METQATAAKKATRKQVAAAKFGDNAAALETAAAQPELAVAQSVAAAVVAATDPAKTGTGLTKAKAAAKRASKAKVVKGEAAELELAPATQPVEAAPAKAKRASKKAAPKADEPEFQPVVVKDAYNHTAIAVARTQRTIEMIPMDSAGMAITHVSRDKFAAEYKAVDNYPVDKAARVYLCQTIAMDPKAKEILELLAGAEADKPIAQGVLMDIMSRHDVAPDDGAAATPAAPKAEKAAKAERAPRTAAPKADRAAKPLGRSKVDGDKALAAGSADFKAKVRPGTFRYALMEAIVAHAAKGGKVADILGKEVMKGKPGVAAIDVTFAVQNGYVAYAA